MQRYHDHAPPPLTHPYHYPHPISPFSPSTPSNPRHPPLPITPSPPLLFSSFPSSITPLPPTPLPPPPHPPNITSPLPITVPPPSPHHPPPLPIAPLSLLLPSPHHPPHHPTLPTPITPIPPTPPPYTHKPITHTKANASAKLSLSQRQSVHIEYKYIHNDDNIVVLYNFYSKNQFPITVDFSFSANSFQRRLCHILKWWLASLISIFQALLLVKYEVCININSNYKLCLIVYPIFISSHNYNLVIYRQVSFDITSPFRWGTVLYLYRHLYPYHNFYDQMMNHQKPLRVLAQSLWLIHSLWLACSCSRLQ